MSGFKQMIIVSISNINGQTASDFFTTIQFGSQQQAPEAV